MADWSKPSLTDPYASVLAELMARDLSASTLSYSNDANIPNGAIRWNPATNQFETYSSSGGNWSAWTPQLNIGTLLLGQNAEPNTMQAIPRRQADAAYQPVGSYAQLIGSKTQPFFAANAVDPQQSTPLNQTQSLISAAIVPYGVLLKGISQAATGVGDCFAAPNGYSSYGPGSKNAPTNGYGLLYTFSADGLPSSTSSTSWVTVIAYDTSSPIPYISNNINGGGWSGWLQLTTTSNVSQQIALAVAGMATQNWAGETFATPGGVNQQITNAVLNPATCYGAAGNTSGNGSCSTSISFTAPCNGRIVVNGSGKCSGNTDGLWFSAANGTGGWCPVVTTVQGGSGYLSPVAMIDGIFGVGAGAQVYLQLSIQGGGSSQVGFIWKFHPTA